MHWLRIDRYYKGTLDNPETYHQPVLCMHCENAPCEVVCPVAATVHSSEGLNDMVYNRCVGTRYCSNNCPYKVRRFNFLQYADYADPQLEGAAQPERHGAHARRDGKMHLLRAAHQRRAHRGGKGEPAHPRWRSGYRLPGGMPTGAIVFGNINDPHSRVAKLRGEPLHYGLLAELNTRPRTTYLAKLRNPNPELTPRQEHG